MRRVWVCSMCSKRVATCMYRRSMHMIYMIYDTVHTVVLLLYMTCTCIMHNYKKNKKIHKLNRHKIFMQHSLDD